MRRRGFTLIELLIVVAIISILAAIAVPNFLEAQTRSKVSRIKADARSLAVAVESYRVDNNRYPPRQRAPLSDSLSQLGDVLTRVRDLGRMTTPISYMTSIPVDVFENRIAYPSNTLDFYPPDLVAKIRFDANLPGTSAGDTSSRYGWTILSVGPDGRFGVPFNAGNYPPGDSSFTHFRQEYDPTNGTISVGNIYRFQDQGANGTRAFTN